MALVTDSGHSEPTALGQDTRRDLTDGHAPRGPQTHHSNRDSSGTIHAPTPDSRPADMENQAHQRRFERDSQRLLSEISQKTPSAYPARRNRALNETQHRRYSFPDTRHDREGGGPIQSGRGYLANVWKRGKAFVSRITKCLGSRVDKKTRLIPQSVREGIRKLAPWLLGVIVISCFAHNIKPMFEDKVTELKLVNAEQSVSLVVARIAQQVEPYVMDKIAEVDPLDLEHPEIANYRHYPGWIHAHDPYQVLNVPRPLVPGWGPPPMFLIRKAFRDAASKWHVDHWRTSFGKNGTVDAVLAQSQAEYAYMVLNKAKARFAAYWMDPYCNTVEIGPLHENITAKMSELGLPFVDPTCTPCTWRDAAMKFGKVFLLGPQAVRDPSRTYCPCSLLRKFQHLHYNLIHLPPAGLARYYPHRRRYRSLYYDKFLLVKAPEKGSSLDTIMKVLERVSRSMQGTQGMLAQQVLDYHGSPFDSTTSEEIEELIQKGWLVSQDLKYPHLPCSTARRQYGAY